MSTARIVFAVFLIAVATTLVVGLCAVGVARAAGSEQQQTPDCAPATRPVTTPTLATTLKKR